MSMTLIVWKSPIVSEPEDARTLLDAFLSTGAQDAFDASDEVGRFYDELMARYPPLEAFDDDDVRDRTSPWAESPERSDRVVLLDLRWSASDEAVDAIHELARTHELVLYDPQGPEVYPPYADDEAAARPGRGEFLQAFAGGAFGVFLVVVAWIASIPLLTWALVVVGGFLAVMAVYTLVVLTQQAWRARS